MKKYEKLFSVDPIGAFEKIEDDYARYFEAAFKINDKSLDNERMDTLQSDDNMSKEPYIEVLPEYAPATSVSSMEDLVKKFAREFGSEEIARLYFEGFISKGLMQGLMDKYLPHGHQIGMLEKAFSGIGEHGEPLKYKNTVITSGTGSGKTESFLLPLLADIFREAKEWGPAATHTGWYNASSHYTPCQRQGDSRPHALRALVLYPMNALVEDQMARLREALDHDDVRGFMERNLKGNRIYFGSYNGSTIGQKNYYLLQSSLDRVSFNNKKAAMAKKLSDIHDSFEFAKNYYSQNADKKEALFMSPRLGEGINGRSNDVTAEMVTRWDMQEWAPDIMITNTSMLSIMLMRRSESKMFEDTKAWLAADPDKKKPTRVFHIVVDELHLYRGTAGSEVACLLRMLYKALGLDPVIDDGNGNKIPNPQIKILASSASLGDEASTQKFLEEFFGLYSTINGDFVFNVQKGFDYIDHIGQFDNRDIDYSIFKEFSHESFVAFNEEEVEIEDKKDQEEALSNRQLAFASAFVKNHFNIDTLQTFVEQYQQQIFSDFYHALPKNTDNSRRPISQSDLKNELFKGDKDALRGFLIFRGYIDRVVKNHKLPRFRFHKFFKYIEGLWGELQPSMTPGTTPVAHLTYTAGEVGPNNRKVLELLRCENCGELFIGGNRKAQEDGKVTLTLNYPSLDQIPSFNPTPMVQNKNYREYAIFWPHDVNDVPTLKEGDVRQGSNDHVVKISDGKYSQANGQAHWQPGYLDSITGEFTDCNSAIDSRTRVLKRSIQNNGIPGFLYKVVNYRTTTEIAKELGTKIYAAPCTCPHCYQDYTQRKYTNSPIRSFRTGIDRSNQLLSKELLYQLDDKSSKLIGFSDSREDAAKQALGIEREQYRDMVRMLFVECVNEIGKEVDDVIVFTETEKQKCGGDFVKMMQIIALVSSKFPNNANAVQIATDYLSGKDVSRYKPTTIPIAKLTGSRFEGPLVRKLLERGINPAGEAYKFQIYDDPINGKMHWSTAYDFNTYGFNNNFLSAYGAFGKEIRTQLESAVFANSFGKYMGVSILDAGIGYISCSKEESIKSSSEYDDLRNALPSRVDVFQFIDAFIRVMGDNYLYPSDGNVDPITDFDEMKSVVKRPIEEFCRLNPGTPFDLGDKVVNFMKKFCTTTTLLLDFGKLAFTKMTKEEYIVCPRCGRVHPNIGFGFCTNTSCMKQLDPNNTISTKELHKHYISHDILVEPRKPRRLHTEELSGQTDDIQARLHEFKDLILVDNNDPYKLGYDMTQSIDMICVTTTMEVGVDIGSLQAILQGNMPPTRYNYQQRVGRGGRRGQAFSTAVTFCRGRSHDVYYYSKATDEMVGGIPATPTLSLAPYIDGGEKKMKIAILKRVIAKEILHLAFISLPYNYELQDTAGEFGTVGEWMNPGVKGQSTKDILSIWLVQNKSIVSDTVHRYLDQFNIDNSIDNDIQSLINWIQNVMVNQIDSVVKKTTISDMGLARYLSESGFLPMYGMPSDSRNFYHGYDVSGKIVRSIDRSSEMAISEFAPGAEKTKDKGKYRVEGLTLPIKDEAETKSNINFYDKNGDALSDSYILTMENDIDPVKANNIKDIEELDKTIAFDAQQIANGLSDKQRLIVIPQAYRSLQIGDNTGTPVENNDKGSSFVQCQVFAKDNTSNSNSKDVHNCRISMYELGLSDDPTIWHINSNNGMFYKGAYQANGMENPLSRKANFMFYDKLQNGNKDEIRKKDEGIEIALGSKKITEMVKLELKSYPDVLNLSLEKGNRSAIRAAFYSAAFLLQRALADKLDVQPDEIEICEKIDDQHDSPVIYLSDSLANGAGIVSYLYQDGKLESLINSIVNFDSFDPGKTPKEKSFMHSLLSGGHRESCLTACQKCLMAYNNRGFHHVLDWRLGVGILRLMIDPTYSFGLAESESDFCEELRDQKKIIQKCATKLGFTDEGKSWEQKGKSGPMGTVSARVIYHPLWNRVFLLPRLLQEGMTAINVSWYNTFKVLRSDLSEDKKIDISIYTNTISTSAPSNDNSLQNATTPHSTTNSSVSDVNIQNGNTFGIIPGMDL